MATEHLLVLGSPKEETHVHVETKSELLSQKHEPFAVIWGKHLLLSDLCNNCKSNKRKIYMCAGTEKAFHFHSFLIDMFFSLSFCIT